MYHYPIPAADYKPWLYHRRPKNRAYAPRSKIPPNWQRAQSFVRALCLQQVGPAPYWGYTWNQHNVHMNWRAKYKKVRAKYQDEDFPINP